MTTLTAPHVLSGSSAPPPGTVVVGIDGSVQSDRALDWAVLQARLEHRALTVVHAAHLSAAGETLWMGTPGTDLRAVVDDLRATGRSLLAAAEARASRADPSLVVRSVLSTHDPRHALTALSGDADLTVVGSRGRGPVVSLLLGSVSVAVSRLATGTVVVVRGEERTRRPRCVVVDVDGTADSVAAVEVAYRIAAQRHLPLTALHVVDDDRFRRTGVHLVRDDDVADHRELLSESVAGMRERYPEVKDELVLERGVRDQQLIAASHRASLLVVAARRRGPVDDLVHDSVVTRVVEHAHCSVAVVAAGSPPG